MRCRSGRGDSPGSRRSSKWLTSRGASGTTMPGRMCLVWSSERTAGQGPARILTCHTKTPELGYCRHTGARHVPPESRKPEERVRQRPPDGGRTRRDGDGRRASRLRLAQRVSAPLARTRQGGCGRAGEQRARAGQGVSGKRDPDLSQNPVGPDAVRRRPVPPHERRCRTIGRSHHDFATVRPCPQEDLRQRGRAPLLRLVPPVRGGFPAGAQGPAAAW